MSQAGKAVRSWGKELFQKPGLFQKLGGLGGMVVGSVLDAGGKVIKAVGNAVSAVGDAIGGAVKSIGKFLGSLF